MLDGVFGAALQRDRTLGVSAEDLAKRSRERARAMHESLAPKHRALVTDAGPWISLLGARRAGKTYLDSALALITGELNPGSIILMGSLTLKAMRRNFWFGAPAGIPRMSAKFGLNLEFNSTELRWRHENGSIGYLLGAETREAMEYWRGIEADLYIVDECKSFAPGILEDLLDDIISPQRMSRRGRVVLSGTPGSIMSGPFWQATAPDARVPNEDGSLSAVPYCVPFGQRDPAGRDRDEYWSFHKLAVQDNTAMPHQWGEALKFKKRKGWADDHPSWRREYLAEWIGTADGLVYAYLAKRNDVGTVNWVPQRTAENRTGLPPEKGPWHLLFGLDLGFQNPTALVVVAWSETYREVRHVWDEQHSHLDPQDVLDMIASVTARFGIPEAVVADAGNLGRMLVEWFSNQGVPIIRAEKTDKYDHVELINSEFHRGTVKVIPGTDLESQLCSVQWDLGAGRKDELARRGKLREDPACANDLTDAFLYVLRYCYHGFAQPTEAVVERGTPEWYQQREREAYQRAAREVREQSAAGLPRGPTAAELPFGTGTTPLPPSGWRWS